MLTDDYQTPGTELVGQRESELSVSPISVTSKCGGGGIGQVSHILTLGFSSRVWEERKGTAAGWSSTSSHIRVMLVWMAS